MDDKQAPWTEPALVAALVRREPRAFTAAYDLYRVRIYSFLVRLCGRRDLADDLFQETFLQLARHAPQLRPDTELAAWLFTVARNRYRSHQRTTLFRRLRLKLAQLGGAADPPGTSAAPVTPYEYAAESDLGRQLEWALLQLGDAQREVLLLVGVEGMEQDRAAAVLGLTPAALRQRLSRARAQVQELLAQAPARPTSQTAAETNVHKESATAGTPNKRR